MLQGRLSRAGRRWATGRSVPCAAACTPQPPICASICSMCTRRPTATSGSLASTAARSAKPSTTSSTTNCKLTASASDRTLRDGAKPSEHRPSHSHRSARSTRSARSARGGDRRSARSQHRVLIAIGIDVPRTYVKRNRNGIVYRIYILYLLYDVIFLESLLRSDGSEVSLGSGLPTALPVDSLCNMVLSALQMPRRDARWQTR